MVCVNCKYEHHFENGYGVIGQYGEFFALKDSSGGYIKLKKMNEKPTNNGRIAAVCPKCGAITPY